MILNLLVPTLMPLYLVIAAGFWGAKCMQIDLKSLADIVIYFLSPVVVFGAVIKLDFKAEYINLIFLSFSLILLITLISYNASKLFFKGKVPNLIGLGSATSNTGFFGLPIVIAIVGAEKAGIYLMINMGMDIVASTVGYYLAARGNFSVRSSVVRVLKLPALHGMWLGLLWNYFDFPVYEVFKTYWNYFAGAWIILGMMIIGVAIGKMPRLEFNKSIFTWLTAVQFVVWPLFFAGVIYIDKNYIQAFDNDIYTLLTIFSICPLGSTVVAFAAQLDVHPEEAGMTVLLTTLIALVYIPLVLYVLGIL